MSALEQALDQHLRMADKTYDEWEEYLDIIDPVKYIKLTQGKYAIVDVDLFDWLNQWKWCTQKCIDTYYAIRKKRVGKKVFIIYMHRQIMGLSPGDDKITDHKNRDGLDNRLSNLRVVNKSTNSQNHGGHKHNTSGYNGVCWAKLRHKWLARITASRKVIHLGYFDNIEDAIIARRLGELKYW